MLAPQGTRAKTWAIDVINAGNGGHFQRTTPTDLDTRVQSKIRSLANLATASEVRNGLPSSRERAAHVVAKPGHTNHLQPFL